MVETIGLRMGLDQVVSDSIVCNTWIHHARCHFTSSMSSYSNDPRFIECNPLFNPIAEGLEANICIFLKPEDRLSIYKLDTLSTFTVIGFTILENQGLANRLYLAELAADPNGRE